MEQIQLAARLMGKSNQEIIRLSTEIGLVRLKRINYDIATVIEAASTWESLNAQHDLKAAEQSPAETKTPQTGN